MTRDPMECPKCHGVEPPPELTPRPDTPHGTMARCATCRATWWLPKPRAETTGIDRNSADVRLCQRVRREATRCAYCGRRARRYEAHHSRALEDGGPQADPLNVVALCHECHLLANWRQKQERERDTRDASGEAST